MATPAFFSVLAVSAALLASNLGLSDVLQRHREKVQTERITAYCRSAPDADVFAGLCDTVRMPAAGFRA